MYISDSENINKDSIKLNASVPGNFELDMERAGLTNEPFFGTNILKLQELENKYIYYNKKFEFNGDTDNTYLLFEGVDTFADIELNGKKIAYTDNMLIPHEIKADGIINGENELWVNIKPTAAIARTLETQAGCEAAKYNWDALNIRKAPHMFGWDIMPRVVSAGIWRSVYLVEKPFDRIDDIYIYTVKIDEKEKTADVYIYFKTTINASLLKDYEIKAEGKCEDSTFSICQELFHTSGKLSLTVENAKLWETYDRGQPFIYETTIELIKNGEVLDSKDYNLGIRTVSLERTSVTDETGSGEFCFILNGQRLFVKGTNHVPCDPFHSRDAERLPQTLKMIKDIGCNAIRCWGGNVYEDDTFYDYCDKNGIMIWQDFAMACAIYPQNDDFQKKIKNEAIAIVQRLKKHPSILVWAGDNECDLVYTQWYGLNRDPNNNILTRKMIPQVINTYAPDAVYLPSSPYVDNFAYNTDNKNLPEDHLWGPRDYFKSDYYKETTAHFASEIGYHGCPSVASIKKFISPDKISPANINDDEWLVHASSPEVSPTSVYAHRNKLMADQIKVLFGFIPDNIEDFSLLSQISQAEALKFFIELFRSAKWRRTGIMWWNLIDGWPQFSDAVVDYYYNKKLAYEYIKRSQQSVCLMFREPTNNKLELTAVNDTFENINLAYTVKNLADGKLLFSSSCDINPNSGCVINSLDYDETKQEFYLIEWKLNGQRSFNHYMAGKPPFNYKKYLNMLKEII